MAKRFKHWRIYDARRRAFWNEIEYGTRAEAEGKINGLTGRRRNASANALRFALVPVPVLADGTCPRAKEWQDYYDSVLAPEKAETIMHRGILEKYAARAGWDENEQLAAIEEYVTHQGSNEAYEDHKREFEAEATADDPFRDWGTDESLDAALSYLDSQGSPEAFEEFLARRAEDELGEATAEHDPDEPAYVEG